MSKDGVTSALDLVKYLLAIASGAIALLIKPEFYGKSFELRVLGTVSLGLLVLSVTCGLFVYSRLSVKLGNSEYDLNDRYAYIPGMGQQLTFAAGLVCAAIAMMIKIWDIPI